MDKVDYLLAFLMMLGLPLALGWAGFYARERDWARRQQAARQTRAEIDRQLQESAPDAQGGLSLPPELQGALSVPRLYLPSLRLRPDVSVTPEPSCADPAPGASERPFSPAPWAPETD